MRAWAPGDMVTERVRLARPLAEGGMGAVWVGEHLMLHAEVAVKFMSERFAGDRDLRERFAREARAAVQIRSPHIVQIMDFGVTTDGVPFIVMELCPGEPLRARLDREGALPAEVVRSLARQLGSALDAAHAAGIVHRDIKPENLLLTPQRDGFLLKVLDFGIAKLHGSQLTAAAEGVTIGTLAYMSPEQLFDSSAVDARADVWSLAVICHEALTGRSPFASDSIRELLMSLQSCRFTLGSELSPALSALFHRAFARGLDHRFSSAGELVSALEAAMSGPGAPLAMASAPRPLAVAQASWVSGSAATRSRPTQPATQPAAPLGLAAAPTVAATRATLPPWAWAAVAVASVALLFGGVVWLAQPDPPRRSRSDDDAEVIKPRSQAQKDEQLCEHLRGFVDAGKMTQRECDNGIVRLKQKCSGKNLDAFYDCILEKHREQDLKQCDRICGL
ncbi:MAG: serine/threonine protein kinase [Polyangiaceae bacterium]|nr:serine/threonine protein kinase [Polyangiaceae bacterium]